MRNSFKLEIELNKSQALLLRSPGWPSQLDAMKKYKVMVEGINFLIGVETEIRKYGFFTTRFVEAWDKDEAEAKVIDMLRVELKALVQNEKSDSPMMFVDETEELETFGEFLVPGAGFAWYPDEREGH